MKCAVIFGGTGFIGCFFADHLIREGGFSKVYLFDVESYLDKPHPYRKKLLGPHLEKIQYIFGDVREEIIWKPEEDVELIANFAAVHREPGHADFEYFHTNIYGAENVTRWADEVGCKNIIFTSSISPYGISESSKNENTLPVPVTAYGSSKLVAEKIHISWRNLDPVHKTLTIVRPGVVFGPGEGGNVTRLVRAVTKGYFFYMGNKDTRKSGIYVKELCSAIFWANNLNLNSNIGFVLFNGSMNPGPSISEYVKTVCLVSGVYRYVPSVPYSLLLIASYIIDFFARPIGISHPFSPVRIRKLVRSNNVLPKFLEDSGYEYKYDLESAMRDWKKDCPEEW